MSTPHITSFMIINVFMKIVIKIDSHTYKQIFSVKKKGKRERFMLV